MGREGRRRKTGRERVREREMWWRMTKLIITIQGYAPYTVSVEQIA